MIAIITTPDFTPFIVAIGLVFALATIEVFGVLAGLSVSSLLDSMLPDIDVDLDVNADADVGEIEADGVGGSFLQSSLAWLCIGKVPSLVVLIILCTAFGLAGLTVQFLALNSFGSTLPVAIASLLAFMAALPLTRRGAMTLARIMPKEYSEAASQSQFVGRVATVIRGVAKRDAPAEAKVKGPFGKTHYILIEPDTDDMEFVQGTEAVIISQVGVVYRGVLNFGEFVAGETDSNRTKT